MEVSSAELIKMLSPIFDSSFEDQGKLKAVPESSLSLVDDIRFFRTSKK